MRPLPALICLLLCSRASPLAPSFLASSFLPPSFPHIPPALLSPLLALPLLLSPSAPPTTPAAPPPATSSGRSQCVTTPSPSKTTVLCLGGPKASGSASLNPVSAAENGVSTSSKSTKYIPPWDAGDPDGRRSSWDALSLLVRSLPSASVVADDVTPAFSYLHATVPTSFPAGLGPAALDDLEFLRRPGDGGLVLVRSSSRAAVYVYPLQQPVGDRDSNKRRLEGIRKQLNWGEAGEESYY